MTTWRVCHGCGQEFLGRGHAKTCSGACRTKLYRIRLRCSQPKGIKPKKPKKKKEAPAPPAADVEDQPPPIPIQQTYLYQWLINNNVPPNLNGRGSRRNEGTKRHTLDYHRWSRKSKLRASLEFEEDAFRDEPS